METVLILHAVPVIAEMCLESEQSVGWKEVFTSQALLVWSPFERVRRTLESGPSRRGKANR